MDLFMKNLGLLSLATVLGALIGLERERAGKSAGLRTHALVALGSALMTIVSIHGFGPTGAPGLRDPARLAAQVVSGIGFLGAGTILRDGLAVKGLTTAASLWTTAGVGLAIGTGMVWQGISATVLVFVVLTVMNQLEKKFLPSQHLILRVTAVDRPGLLGEVATIVGNCQLSIVGTDINVDREASMVSIDIIMANKLSRQNGASYSNLLQGTLALPGVLRAEMDSW